VFAEIQAVRAGKKERVMATQSDLNVLQTIIDGLKRNPAARFSYTQEAFDADIVDGVQNFDKDAEQNIPAVDQICYNPTVINKGVRTQGASIPRMAWNHFIGRVSYNLNKLVQKSSDFIRFFRASLAHNAAEYDGSAQYRHGDMCYIVWLENNRLVCAWYSRISTSPVTIQGIPPTVEPHWRQVQVVAPLISVDNADVWALRIEDDGILYMYYDEGCEPPPLSIDYDPQSPTRGQLMWEIT
jgi:hypothetical protein